MPSCWPVHLRRTWRDCEAAQLADQPSHQAAHAHMAAVPLLGGLTSAQTSNSH